MTTAQGPDQSLERLEHPAVGDTVQFAHRHPDATPTDSVRDPEVASRIHRMPVRAPGWTVVAQVFGREAVRDGLIALPEARPMLLLVAVEARP